MILKIVLMLSRNCRWEITHKGPKTAKRIREIQRENAEKSRLTEVENNLKKNFNIFPLMNLMRKQLKIIPIGFVSH